MRKLAQFVDVKRRNRTQRAGFWHSCVTQSPQNGAFGFAFAILIDGKIRQPVCDSNSHIRKIEIGRVQEDHPADFVKTLLKLLGCLASLARFRFASRTALCSRLATRAARTLYRGGASLGLAGRLGLLLLRYLCHFFLSLIFPVVSAHYESLILARTKMWHIH